MAMKKANFSVVCIAKNEEKTIERLSNSLKEFMEDYGGECILVDTGSIDKTVELAKSLGWKVYEEGNRFRVFLTDSQVADINNTFMVDTGSEYPIVNKGDSLFDFSSARNYAASLASNDTIASPDIDEEYTKLDIDKVCQAIKNGVEQLEYNFVFSHDQFGNELIKFLHCKFYNRTKLKWTGIIHEVLTGEAKRQFLDESIIKLEHWQQPSEHRGNYLKGLALDCFLHPENDRNAHYFGRELLWTGRPRAAIKQLKRHIDMNGWQAERSQSMIYVGDAYLAINDDVQALEWYHKAFLTESGRREPFIKLADYFYKKGDPQRTAAYVEAVLTIPKSNFYANFQDHYENYPHELAYWAYWQLGDKEKSKEHFDKAFAFRPLHSKYLHDYRFYYDLPLVTILLPTLGKRPEGLERCLDSIKKLNYPQYLIETIVLKDEPRRGVPERVKEGVEKSKGYHIVFASDDIEFTPDSLIQAVIASDRHALVAFETGGEVCEHFLIRKTFISKIGGEIFDTRLSHVGVDNLLWEKCKKLNQAIHLDPAKITHYHFSRGSAFDETYEVGWKRVEEDRALLKELLIAI